ncbi:hypothetical protein [uncultured Algibacter sp.]|uniref:hypothetical protein n=1 Tax=uncultured Algibacter sp. TaxID=298659 RepID=UPI0026363AE0|nr:hypothetical protein [uncultured Algibacter sp.]
MKIIKYNYRFCILIVFIGIFNCSSDESTEKTTPLFGVKVLGGSLNDSAQAITSTIDGGYAVLGFSQSDDGDVTSKQNKTFDYWLLKFDSNNALSWQKTYGGSGDDRGNDIIQTNDNGYIIFGQSSSSDGNITNNAGSLDFWLSKIDSSGNIIWNNSFGFSGVDNGISLIETKDNGYLLTGVLDVTASGGEGNSKFSTSKRHAGGDYWAIKLNSNGDKQWSKFYGGTFTDTPNDVIQTTDNGYLIIGSSDSNDVDISDNKGSYDMWIIKISETGNLLWEKSFGGSEIDEAYNITSTNDGNYLIVGNTRSSDNDVSFNNGAADLWMIKISETGNMLWEKTLGGNNFDSGSAVSKTQDGGFILSGNSRSLNGNLIENKSQNDAWLIKIDANANIEWQKTIGGTEIDFANDITQLNDGTYVAVGETSSSNEDITENKGFADLLIITINE